jgi:hypothetical protein
MMPRSREVTTALVAISSLFFLGSVLPYTNGRFDEPVGTDPNFWGYHHGLPFSIGFSALTFLLPLVALGLARTVDPVRARLLLIVFLAAAGSWNVADVLANRGYDVDQAIGSFLITGAAVLAIALAAAQVVAEWRSPWSVLDRLRTRWSLFAILLATALFAAGTLVELSELIDAYRYYQLLLVGLTAIGLLVVVKAAPTTRRFSILLLPAAMLGWFALPAYVVFEGTAGNLTIEINIEEWLYIGAFLTALAGIAIGVTGPISSDGGVPHSTGNGANRGVT